jgi:dTDP-4-amino-4,6-dideoxygalactose transaminase
LYFYGVGIPFLSLTAQHQTIRAEMLVAIARVYDSEWFVLGKEVEQFEEQYAAFSQVPYCVGVGNGLDALTLSLRALGIGPGDEVIVPANTYIATWLAVTQVGATLVPVEPLATTSNLDPTQLAGALTARTRVIMPVHLYGQACEMKPIMAFARQHGLYVVEDNAQAQGAAYAGTPTGAFGHASATSFYPTKNLGALGDAGAITTADIEVAQRLRALRNYGSAQKNHHTLVGFNSRLDELQAAILRIKLPLLATWVQQRQQVAALYDHYLAGIAGLRLPYTAPGATHAYHLYVVHTLHRDALQQHLAEQGIGTAVHYPVPPHLQPAYVSLGLPAGQFPISEELARTCLSLPLWPGMTEEQVATVARAVASFVKQWT